MESKLLSAFVFAYMRSLSEWLYFLAGHNVLGRSSHRDGQNWTPAELLGGAPIKLQRHKQQDELPQSEEGPPLPLGQVQGQMRQDLQGLQQSWYSTLLWVVIGIVDAFSPSLESG